MNKKHVGSDFDDFLAEEGLLEEVEAVAGERVLVYQLSEATKEDGIAKAATTGGGPRPAAPR